MKTELIAAALAAAAPAPAPDQAPARKQAVIALPFNGGLSFDVHTDDELVANAGEHEAEMYPPRGRWLAMSDTYASRPGADGACADGKETYVRLLDIETQTEISATLAASCRRGIAASAPVLTWKADGSGFTINLTSAAPVWVPVPTGE